jgi:YcaO-like protein with predicted kinase domain
MTRLMRGVSDPGQKTFVRETHRLVDPDETVAAGRPLMRRMGITRLANITGLDHVGIPVAIACRPNSRGLAVSQGKGLDLAAAKASALMESVESYHAERIELPLKLGSQAELTRTHRLADVTRLPRTVGSAFHPNRPLLWIEGHDLLQDEPVWVPYEVVETNYTYPLAAGSGCFQATTNGLAAGNHLLEAVSHAFCEVVERDAIAVWNSRGPEFRRSRRIDLGTVASEPVVGVLERLDHAGIDAAAWNVTSDVGVACVLATIVDRPLRRLRPAYPVDGSGCHPARDIALLRALLEAVQSRLTFIAGSRDDNFYEDYDRLFDPANALAARARVAEDALLGVESVPDAHHETFLEDVEYELERLRAAGIVEAVVVDLSRADLGLPVVRVVVPGLEGVSTKPDYVTGRRAQAAWGAAR